MAYLLWYRQNSRRGGIEIFTNYSSLCWAHGNFYWWFGCRSPQGFFEIADLRWMIFLPTSRKVLPTFQIFWNILPSWGPNSPDCSSFCPRSSSGQEKGCFWVGLEMFCVCTYPRKRCVSEQRRGLGVVFWAKWDPIWAKWDPSRQIVQEVGKSALELGKKIPNHRFEAMYKPNVSLLQWRKWIPVCVLWWKKIHGGMLIPRRNWSEEHRYASA